MQSHREIIEQANLSSPSESVHFLEYMKGHAEKVEKHGKKLHRLSKLIFFVALSAVAYQVYAYFMTPAQASYSGAKHRLGATNEADNTQLATTFNGFSLAIWGLVLKKAQGGIAAAQTKEKSTINSMMRSAGTMCFLIIGASMLQLIAQYESPANVAAPVAPAAPAVHRLQAGHTAAHPESFYDESSSHYMGGAHNVLLQQSNTPTVNVASQSSMGGAHNVALNAIAMKSNSKSAVAKVHPVLGASISGVLANKRPVTQQEFNQNLKSIGTFVGLIGTVGTCIYFFVTMKVYQGGVVKLDALHSLLNNPNARVATAEQGKNIMQQINGGVAPKAEATTQLAKADSIQSTLNKVESLLSQARQKTVEETPAPSGGFYKPPKLQAARTQKQPEQSAYELASMPSTQLLPTPTLTYQAPAPQLLIAPQSAYPMVPQGLAVQTVQTPQPQQSLDSQLQNLPRAQVLNMLLSQLAKSNSDIERQA